MKKRHRLWPLLVTAGLIALAVVVLFTQKTFPGWERPEGISYAQERKLQKELWEIGGCFSVPILTGSGRETVDAMEAVLLERGWPVLDTDEIYPAWLENAEGLRKFWESAQNGKKAETSLLRVTEERYIFLSHFFSGRGETCCVLVKIGWEQGNPQVEACELLPVYDMELADWDIFYYRLFPKDPHYIDYMQVRLTPPDREKYDLCRKYILPIGYQMVNFFLCDWEEGDWGSLSFNDVFDALYQMKPGNPPFSWTDFADPADMTRARIPAKLFEETVMAYFQISREELRELAGYQAETDSYPWRTFFGDDLTTRRFPFCEPQVAEVAENGDGTLTLTIQVTSPEVKGDCVFTHTLVVRTMEDGSFQYVSNQVTEVGQWGLPFDQPRFILD